MRPDVISDYWLWDTDIFKDNSTELLCVERKQNKMWFWSQL